MSDQGRGDDVYQPQQSDVRNRPDDELDLRNALDDAQTDDTLDDGYSPPERPLGVGKRGTTGAEQQVGDSLDERFAQEVPDADVPVYEQETRRRAE
ncbi:hypothetical protein [Streptomyces sp. NPDC059909]|uniref:hypothetical protein n=1 Tax=Streptomyces sp. NPDC059909 TaxID=3346998 RepID=UPI0036575B80